MDVTIKLEDHDAAALAIICAKANKENIQPFAIDSGHAELLLETLETIREQLWGMGYNPDDVKPMKVTE